MKSERVNEGISLEVENQKYENPFSPADEKSCKIWCDQGRRSGEHVNRVRQQHCRLSTKAGGEQCLKKSIILSQELTSHW